MYNPLKAIIAATALILLCSCSEAVEIKVEERTYQTDNAVARLNLPQFSCDTSADFAESMNNIYNNEASALMDAFFAKETQGEEQAKLELDSTVTRNDGRIVSIVCEGEAFTGGAHGEKLRIAKTADFADGKVISLEELFDGEEWKMAADNKMQKLAQKAEGDYSELWEMPSTELLKPENFYLKDDKLVLYFPPYELSYYRRGYVEFEFEREELAGYLSEYGREVL